VIMVELGRGSPMMRVNKTNDSSIPSKVISIAKCVTS
jgi:hypothetical protein